MRKTVVLLLAILAITFTLPATNLMAQGGNSSSGQGTSKKSSPFLITGKMPHLTKLLIKQWDSPRLNLSAEQKNKLLVIRQETIAGVQTLAQQVVPLEKQVAEGIFARQTPEELSSLVQSISKLKIEATMAHLRCIYNTSKILDQQQLEFLLH